MATGLILFLVVVWVFLPVLHNGFLSFDDGCYVTANAEVQSGLTWHGVVWALCQPVAGNWHPVTVLSHMLDCQFFGLKAWGHHLTNVLLHAANAALLFVVFQRMTDARWRSATLAALFALHPLRVQSVAWIAERKDVLSTLFWFLTMLAYARYVEETRRRGEPKLADTGSRPKSPARRCYYVLALIAFALGLMCKAMLVSLPFVLLLLDYWPLGRFKADAAGEGTRARVRVLVEKLPFFGLAAGFCVITVLTQTAIGAVATDLPLGVRLANALVSYPRYLARMIWPENLAAFYPHPGLWPMWQVAAAGVFLLSASAVVFAARRRPYLIVGWLWFCGTLLPVIGLIQAGNQSIADRYTYVPAIGLLVMLVWGVNDLTAHWRYRTPVVAAATAAVAVVCILLSRQQIGYWKDDESLWRHAVAATRNNSFAHLKLGAALATKGQIPDAMAQFEEAIRLNPRDDRGYTSLARALVQQGRLAAAVQQYEAALALNPSDAGVHNDLGLTLARLGRADEAVRHYQEALRLKAGFAEAHYNLGLTLASHGDFQQAAEHFRETVRLDPANEKAQQKLELAVAMQKKLTNRVAK